MQKIQWQKSQAKIHGSNFYNNFHWMLSGRVFIKKPPKKHLVIIRIQVSIEITFPPQWRIWDAIRVDEYPT